MKTLLRQDQIVPEGREWEKLEETNETIISE